MKFVIVLSVLLLGVMPSGAMAQDVVRQYSTTIKLKVDTRGQVTQVGTPDRLPDMLVAPVRKAAKAWRFKPLQTSGHAVSVTTFAHATVKVVREVDKRYGLRVIYDCNGPKLLTRLPKYPRIWIGTALEPKLLFAITIKPDGSLADVHAVKTLGGNRGRVFSQGVKMIRDDLMHWRALPMRVNGKPAFSHIKMTIAFGRSWVNEKHTNSSDDHAAPAWARAPSGGLIASDSPLQRLSETAHVAADIKSDKGT